MADGRSSRLLSLSTESEPEDDEARLRRLLAEEDSDEEIVYAARPAPVAVQQQLQQLPEDQDLADETMAALLSILGSPSGAEGTTEPQKEQQETAAVKEVEKGEEHVHREKHRVGGARQDLLEWADEHDEGSTPTKTSKLSAIKDDPGPAFKVQQEEADEAFDDFSYVAGSYEVGGENVEVSSCVATGVG
jgi:hypothetical protein